MDEISAFETIADKMEPLAIIGLAIRGPEEVSDSERLWEFLLRARQAAAPVPPERFTADAFYHPDPEHGGTFHIQGGNFLSEDPAFFDYTFFNVTKTELLTLDPQQRLILENVFHALENACSNVSRQRLAGIPMEKSVGSNTSVYATGFNHDHVAVLNADLESPLKYKITGVSNSIISNRISWFWDFKGPSLTLDTACSSSMVALHLAAQSLRSGESDMSIISGVNIIEYPADTIAESHHGFLSAEGKCFSFDHRANGYARGEGVASIVVKRLSSALRDGDTIRAVIRNTGVNQDGRTAGITLPSAVAQERLIRQVYRDARLDPRDTAFVEAHGTGTAAGDPVEAAAIAKVFGAARKQPVYIGALKSNIGHLEGGSGVAAVIKAIFVLENGIIPPNQNFEKINPRIPLAKWNLKIPLQNTPWPNNEPLGLRRISVNSFGVGGTNAHCILDDAYHYLLDRNLIGNHHTCQRIPTQEEIDRLVTVVTGLYDGLTNGSISALSSSAHTNGDSDDAGTPSVGGLSETNISITDNKAIEMHIPLLYFISAFDEGGIKRNASQMGDFMIKQRDKANSRWDENMYDIAYTLSCRRSVFPWKSYVVAGSWVDLVQKLSNGSGVSQPIRSRNPPMLGFVFTSQGAQHYAMGRELLVYPVFRNCLADATKYMTSLGSSWSLLDELLKDKGNSSINSPAIAHPACAVIQIALVDLLASWGILPLRVTGHSSGEIAAAYAAGKLSREAAWKVAYYRGYVSVKQLSARGAMMAVGLNEMQLQPYLDKIHREHSGELRIACFNSPNSHTVSGDEVMVDRLRINLLADEIFCQKLMVQNAYHSAHMEEVAQEYLHLLGSLPPLGLGASQKVHMFSSLTGKRIVEQTLPAQYWVDNLVSPVRFSQALSALCLDPVSETQAALRVNSKTGGVFVEQIMEIGPHTALQGPVKEIIAAKRIHSPIDYLPVLNRNEPGISVLLNSVGKLCAQGLPVNIGRVNQAGRPSDQRQPQMLTDLPPYSFNHTDKTLYQSRLAKNIRFRKFPRMDLIGAPVADWNARHPKWRHFLRLEENPWLKDHVVTDNIVYPGVGYLIMAIEASKQVAESTSELARFRFKNVSIKKAMIIPDTKEGIEVSFSMTRVDETSLWSSSVWSRFEIQSFNPVGDDWIEHCTGYISVEYAISSPGAIDDGREAREEAAEWRHCLEEVTGVCQVPMDFNNCYDNLQTAGLTFGPLFRNLSNVKVSGQNRGIVTGTITVPDVKNAMPKNFIHPHLIHPATMDSMIHLLIAALIDAIGKGNLERAAVPTFISEAWVSASISSLPTTTFRGRGQVDLIAYEKYECDVKIWDGDSHEGCIEISGLRLTPLETSDGTSQNVRKLNHLHIWRPDIAFLDTPSFLKLVGVPKSDYESDRFWASRFQLATLLMITDALKELKQSPWENLKRGHLCRYYEWMEHQRAELLADRISGITLELWERFTDNPLLKESLYQTVAEYNAEGALAVRMGTQIARVLRKEVDPLDLMFGQGDDFMDNVYDYLVNLGDIPLQLRAYLSFLSHGSADLRILEVGAGTGSSTLPLLEALSPRHHGNPESKISEYCFTDLSASFFNKAKERFKAWGDIMVFHTLNIENDPSAQELEIGSYDIVVAGNVLHATSNLGRTLKNVCSLLKPGGKLLLQEGIRQDMLSPALAFGQLNGWWLGIEDTRKWSPFVPASEWDAHLRKSGFSGVDIMMPQARNPEFCNQAILVSSKVEDAGKRQEKVKIITPAAPSESNLVSEIRSQLQSQLVDISVLHPLELRNADLSDTVCLFVAELERPILYGASEEEYLNIRHLMVTCGGLLWVTGNPKRQPAFGLITGLIRTVRWERDFENTNLVPLNIIDEDPSPLEAAMAITRVLRYQFMRDSETDRHSEYQFANGILYNNRLIECSEANLFLTSHFSRPAPQIKALNDINRPIKLSTATPGLLSKLQWVTDTAHSLPLADTEVEVDIRAVGLNFRDVMIAMGEHMAYSLGSEGAGIVTRVGSAVSQFKQGDRVVYMGGLVHTGCFHTYGRVDQEILVRIPDSVPLESAAGLPVVYSTAIYGLRDVAHLKKGESILIHAAAGGVGQAAIQYAQIIGADIYATVSSPKKRDILVREYGIAEDHIFSTRDLTFAPGIMRRTNGRGVDVILNSLSDEALRRSWGCIAPFGRFLEIGKKDAQAYGKVELTPFLRNVTMASVELPTMIKYRPDLVKRLTQEAMSLYTEGKITDAKPTTFMSYSQIEDGFRSMQSGKSTGKIIFIPDGKDLVPVIPETPPPLQFSPNASYVLAGGLGGIGRSLAKWMVSRGATQLIFLSRSGVMTESVQKMLNYLRASGCNAKLFKCDVSDGSRLESVIQECEESMSPIKGCIQCSMTLKDGIFENMTYNDWQTATKPKAQGSWNLHNALPKDMDFFVLLSSATGIMGNRSQANYAAGNTYEDALAQYRVSEGLPAASIDLGSVLSVGFVAENKEYARHTTAILEVLREDEIHGMIEYLIDPRNRLTEETCQLVTGLTTGIIYRQRGIPPPTYLGYPLFRHLQNTSSLRAMSSENNPEYIVQELLSAATTIGGAVDVISNSIRTKLSDLLAIPADNIDPVRSISSNGVDSLVAMEFRTWLSKNLKAEIPLLEITGPNSITTLSEKIASISSLVSLSASVPSKDA
ncbi:putative polyketide synthase [Bisporella sp. PMI_857]|nr:putative polyketide synthase [Bisporella sp. PMI_857]